MMTTRKDRVLKSVAAALAPLHAALAFWIGTYRLLNVGFWAWAGLGLLLVVASVTVAVLGVRSALRDVGGPAPRWIWLGVALFFVSIPPFVVLTFI